MDYVTQGCLSPSLSLLPLKRGVIMVSLHNVVVCVPGLNIICQFLTSDPHP